MPATPPATHPCQERPHHFLGLISSHHIIWVKEKKFQSEANSAPFPTFLQESWFLRISRMTKWKSTERQKQRETETQRGHCISFRSMLFILSTASFTLRASHWITGQNTSCLRKGQNQGWASLFPYRWSPRLCFSGQRNRYQTCASWSCRTSGPGSRPIWQCPQQSR